MYNKMNNKLQEAQISKEEAQGFFREALVNIIGREETADELQNVCGLEIDELDIVYFVDYIF